MKKVVGLTISALLVMALVAGGTYAYFSDQQVSTGNVFTAGTLDIGLSSGTSNTSATGNTTATFSTGNTWKPGDTRAGKLFINNDGNLTTGNITVTFTYDNSTMTAARPANITGSSWITAPYDYFDQMINATTATWKVPFDTGTPQHITQIEGKTLLDLKTGAAIPLSNYSNLNGTQEGELDITFTFNPNATNGCQNSTLTANVTVTAYQNTTSTAYP